MNYCLSRDNVEWDSEQEQAAQQKINENSNVKLGLDQQGMLHSHKFDHGYKV